jgi:hypothetical protein
MGNHEAGRAIGRMVLALVARRREGEDALAILDEACNPWRGADAEFESEDPNNPGQIHPDYDDYRYLPSPMARLMVEAFAPNGLTDLARYQSADPEDEEASDTYYEEVVMPFRERYEFC